MSSPFVPWFMHRTAFYLCGILARLLTLRQEIVRIFRIVQPVILSFFLVTSAWSAEQEQLPSTGGVSANPGATNVLTGTALLGRVVGFDAESGVRLGGLWLGDSNYLFAGGNDPQTWSFNSLLLLDLSLDLEKLLDIRGAQFGIEFLQFNGQDTNGQAGVVPGYNSLPGPAPLDRSELYELWWRQELFDEKLIFRLGKTVPTFDFGNVIRPLSLKDESLAIPSVSSLIYTSVFINPTLLGAMPGYYNSAYGVTVTVAPVENIYISGGVYDGTVAFGEQTGLDLTPHFNGKYFMIGEVGFGWQRGPNAMPGTIGVGGWKQTGQLSLSTGETDDGVRGIYTFGSQRLWLRNPGIDSSGMTGFFQFGINDSETLPVDKHIGGGVTFFGLVPERPNDSMGAGVSVSWLNQNLGFRNNEVTLAAYYQLQLVGATFLQPTLSFIPNPGQHPDLSAATAFTLRATILF